MLQDRSQTPFVGAVDVRIYPQSDDAFAAAVQRVLEDFDPRGVDESILESRLRDRFPAIQVRRRHRLARVSEGDQTVYVFRDGHV